MTLESQTITRADSADEKLAKMNTMLSLLEKRPQTTLELAESIKNGQTLTLRYLSEMEKAELIERIPNSAYWQKKGHVYSTDLQNAVITDIPEVLFREIPIIKPWYNYALGNPARLQYVNTFKAICYGRVVEKFKINPSKWVHKVTTDVFYQAYKEQYGKEFSEHIQKGLKAFLSYCLNVQFTNSDKRDFFGLVVKKDVGKYRYVKMSKDELDAAINWLDSEQAKQLCIQEGLQYDRLKAHFAFALEGFPRPSRCLTIETERVVKYRDNQQNLILHWMQSETKQKTEYAKFMQDNRLVQWAVPWVDKRRTLNYRYLFLDDSNYQVQRHDTAVLATTRRPYVNLYKAMFKALGKDGYFLQDTLYSLRHCGVQMWLERTDYNYDLVAQMGWEDITTLRKFYGGMSSSAVLQFILQGNKKD